MSYLTAEGSRDLIQAAHQKVTRAWWATRLIATAAVHGMDYLLSWNCKQIANAMLRSKIEGICRATGFEPPVICTPLELVEE